MEEKEIPKKRKKNLSGRLLKIFGWIVLSVIGILLLIALLIQFPLVQNFAKKKAVSYLENKLHTKVSVDKINIHFPTSVSLQKVCFEDRAKDTLLYGENIRVDISMWQLMRSEINIRKIYLDGIVTNIYRQPPDSVFNFQFIIDAFSGGETTEDTSSPMKISVGEIVVDRSRFIFRDLYGGHDVDVSLKHFATSFKTFDPGQMIFAIKRIEADDMKGHFYMLNSLHTEEKNITEETNDAPANDIQLAVGAIDLTSVDFQFNSDPLQLKSAYLIGRASLRPKNIDLENLAFALKDATLDQSAITIEMASSSTETSSDIPEDTSSSTFKFTSDRLTLKRTGIKVDRAGEPHIASGMDYNHLYFTEMNMHAEDVLYSSDSIRATVKSGSLKEKSGLVLTKINAGFEMTPTGITLNGLYIQTPGSEIKRYASIRSTSLAGLPENMGKMGVDITLNKSTIAVKDLLLFAPQLDPQLTKIKNQTVFVDGILSGTMDNLQFKKFTLKGLTGTDINLNGTIAGLPDPDKINADLHIEKFATNKKDITSLLPGGTLSDNIQLPSQISAYGTINGDMNNLRTNLQIKTDLGNTQLNGMGVNITDRQNARYDLAASVDHLQLGAIMTYPELGALTGDIRAEGTGLDPQTANVNFKVNIPAVAFHQYNYKNITAEGAILEGRLKADFQIKDPGVSTAISLTGNFSNAYPAVSLDGVIDSVDMMALHFTSSPLKYHGRVTADFKNTHPDSLTGSLFITQSIVATEKQRFQIDTVSVVAEAGDGNNIAVNTGFASLDLRGQYKLTQLADVFTHAIHPYFDLSDNVATAMPDPYRFTVTGAVYEAPALKAILPALQSMQPVQLGGTFDSESGFNINFASPHIQYNDMNLDGLKISAGTRDSAIAIQLAMEQFIMGGSAAVYKTTVDGMLANNELTASIRILDKVNKQKYFLKGGLREETKGNYVFSLLPDSLRLNYDPWNIHPKNQILFGDRGLIARNFVLREGDQTLSINSDTTLSSLPLQLEFSGFRLSTLTGMIQSDSLFINGMLNGKAVIKDMQTDPVITADIRIDDLSAYNDTLGVLTARVGNKTANQYHADISLEGYGNDLKLNGDYIVKPENSAFDLALDIKQLQMKSVAGLTNGAIRDGKGFIYGQLKANGAPGNPAVNGNIRFNQVSFIPSQLNSVFKIDDKATAIINDEGIRFNSFTLRDTTNNALTLGGVIRTKDWTNFDLGMTVRANQFHAINSTRSDNNSFFGKFVFSTSLNIKGAPARPVIDGSLTVNDETSFTIVLPTEDPTIVERDGIVRFVDFNATAEDSLFMNAFDSLKTAPLLGYDVTLNIDISKDAAFNLIVDPANGDYLEMRGTGQLSGGIDPSGKINLTGEYEVEEGAYSLSFNFLKRKFLIQKGSRIEWTGDPTRALVDITAVYQTNTAPYELVQQMMPENDIFYKQKIPVEVLLKMEGELLKPQISFDIVLPDKIATVSADVINTVDERLAQLRQEPSDLNKQVFALLLLNRFVGENPFDNSGSQGLDASVLAKQSASRLLTEQLNNLTEGLIRGVDLNFDLATTEDYTSGEKQDRTNLRVGVTKRLLNDRLSVTVGNNFELEGSQQSAQDHIGLADNISVNYMLSKDGRYMLRAYRTNDYTGALEGYVIETGISFVITVDYNKLAEIFNSKKEREKKRSVRRYNRSVPGVDGIPDRRRSGSRAPATPNENEKKDEQ